MTRNDWIFVGFRLYGLYLLVGVFLRLPALVAAIFEGVEFDAFVTVLVLPMGTSVLAGWVLLAGAPSILAWLESKDSRLEASARG